MTSATSHSLQRHQQRGIPALVVDLLFKYGEACNTRSGEILHFSRRVINKLRRAGAAQVARIIAEYRDCYLVCCDGRVVTVGYRYRRIRDKVTNLRAHRPRRSWRRRHGA